MAGLDTNVDNYTIGELMSIFNIDYLSDDEINDSFERLNEQLVSNNKDTKLIKFITDIKNKLKQYNNSVDKNNLYENESAKKQTDEWWKFEALPQKDKVQKDKITDRIQKIDVYNDQHVPMNRDQLGVSNTYEVPVAQDSLNPNLKNVTSRIINLDSQFRQASGGIDSISSNFTLDLSDPLTDVISLRVVSIQIPFTWYVIDYQYGNTCFWITNKNNYFKISIEPGNYTTSTFVVTLNEAITNAGFVSTKDFVTYKDSNGKITLSFNDTIDPKGNVIKGIVPSQESFESNIHPYFTFFDFTGEKVCQVNCVSQNLAFNNCLGWLMGFRSPIEPIIDYIENNDGLVERQGNLAIATLDLIGPKYFIVVLDDYNQNHINNGLVSITEIPNILKLPSYYNPTIPTECLLDKEIPINEIGNISQLSAQNALLTGVNPLTISNTLPEKLNISYKKNQQVKPTAPRTLTQAQIYTINEIIKNRDKNTSFRGKAPTASDTFAILPLKLGNMKTGELYSEFGGTLQENKRVYFGPVDIDRMQIKLLDDKGFIVDLHGAEWCLTLISENLYQY